MLTLPFTLGGGDPNPKPKTFLSQEQIDAFNAQLRDFAKRKGLMNAEDMVGGRNVGDVIPPYIDSATGKDITDVPVTKFPPNMKMKLSDIPNYVGANDLQWDKSNNWPYYVDEKSGDYVPVHPDLFYSTRFNPNRGTYGINRSLASK